MTVKLISLIRRRPDISREAFIAYYEAHHVRLGLKHTEMCGYRRNYVDPNDPVIPGDPQSLGFDVITESLFPDRAALERSWAHCASPAIAAQFAEDEAKFIDRAASRTFLVDAYETPTVRHDVADDHRAIETLIHRYALAIDSHDWPALASLFVETAVLDYSAVLRAHGVEAEPIRGRDAIVAHARDNLDVFAATQHFVSNIMPVIERDHARATTYVCAHHVDRTDSSRRWVLGGLYHDRLVRTAAGWKIEHRLLEPLWEEGAVGRDLIEGLIQENTA